MVKNTKISKYYLINRYNYLIYFLFIIGVLLNIEKNNWAITNEIIIVFTLVTLFFIIINLIYSDFCFSQQVKISRMDYETLVFKKGLKKYFIKKEDINTIYFTAFVHIKKQPFYKVIVIDQKGEKYRFINPMYNIKIDKSYQLNEFLQNTENFWRLNSNSVKVKYRNLFEKIEIEINQ